MSGSDPAFEVVDDRADFDSSHPEADPTHPRYEPPYLRHQPGDTWQIGGKPYDPEDPGPYGNPLWRPDTRTGRHRRNELPDPPPTEPVPGEGPVPGPTRHGPRGGGMPSSRAASPQPGVSPGPDTPSGSAAPEQRPSPGPLSRPGQSNPDRSRPQFWTEADRSDSDNTSVNASVDARLRENAWDDFMTDSAPLAAAHHQTQPRRRPALDREAGLALAMWIAVLRWLFTLIRSIRQGDGQSPSLCSPGHLGTAAAADHTQQGPQRRTPHRGRSGATDRTHQGPQAAKAAAPPLTLPTPRPHRTATTSAMAQAIAGAQRARAGVASWA